LSLALVHGQVTPIWPPSGIALVAFLLMGRQVWPAIVLAAFALNLPIGPSVLGALAISIGNTLAPLIAAEILRLLRFRPQLDRLRDALAIIAIGALGGMTISATVGSSVLVSSGVARDFWTTWTVWWTGDAMGVLMVAPFLLSLLARPWPTSWKWIAGLELAALLLATGVVAYVLFHSDLRLEYLVLPLIMAAAWRFRLRGAAPAALIASGVAVWCAVKGVGPFAQQSLLDKMVTLQVFNVSVALASFVFAALVETRDRESEVARLYAAEKSANEAKTRFLHMAAHELRTPISVLSGYVSILSDGSLGPVPEGWKNAFQILTTKTRELNRLVSDLLEASRIGVNALPQTRSNVDLGTVVAEARERARPRAGLLGGEILSEAPAEPILVSGDPIQLGRILDNLINNALSYCERTPKLTLRLASDNGAANIRVIDNGIGIPAAQQQRIFEQFHRANDGAFRNVPGTGLGLYISRELARAHGGELSVESSSPESGTVFLLSLPRVEQGAQLVTEPSRAALAEELNPVTARRAR
jgi:signal transduction histidine kinase